MFPCKAEYLSSPWCVCCLARHGLLHTQLSEMTPQRPISSVRAACLHRHQYLNLDVACSTGPSAAGPTSLQGPTSAVGTGSTAQSPTTAASASPAAPTTPGPSPSPPVTSSPTVTRGASPPVVSGSLGGFSTGV